MNKRQSSVDGFIARRSSNDRIGDLHNVKIKRSSIAVPSRKQLYNTEKAESRALGQQKTEYELSRPDIDESLKGIGDIDVAPKKLSRRQRRRLAKLEKKSRKASKPKSKLKTAFKTILIVALLAALSAGGYVAYKFIAAGNSVIKGNILDLFKNKPLKQDENGRSNFLILGTSEDDPGHGGSDLTDSMLVVSIDQTKKDIYMFSVPRDLYVDYDMACVSGYSGKINAYFSCVNDGATAEDEQDRMSQTQKLVGDIFDLDIQYGVHVNHTVIKQVVDAVGGIDVDIQGSNGDPGVYDRNFDWRCNYKCYLVKYDNGIHHLDGEHALYLSMARGDVAPTYGLGNSNFDREKNQQKILVAIKDKAMSVGTLTNLGAITRIIDALGDNLRTNIAASEIRTLVDIAGKIKTSNIHSISLVKDGERVMTTGNYNGASVVMPSAGIFDYSDIQAYIKKNISSDPIISEAAPIMVLNGTGQTGYAKARGDELTSDGYTVKLVDNAPEGTYQAVEIYQIGDGNTGTAKKLASRYGVKIKTTKPPVIVTGDVRFVIIFGSAEN